MANDAVGYLGLDTKDFREAVKQAASELERLNSAANRTDSSVKGIGGTMGLMRNLAALSGVTFALKSLGRAMMDLGNNAEAATNQFQAGGSRLSANTPDSGTAGFSAGIKPMIEDSAKGFWNKVASVGLGMSATIGASLSKIFGGNEALDDYLKGIKDIEKEGQSQIALNEKIAGLQDELSESIKRQTPDFNAQLDLLEKQLAIQEEKLKYANLDTQQGRSAANQAKEAIGAGKLQIDNMKFGRELQAKMMASESLATSEKLRGQNYEAQITKVNADFERKIAADKRTNNGLFVQDLLLQQKNTLALMDYERTRAQRVGLTERDIAEERTKGKEYEAAQDAVILQYNEQILTAYRDGNLATAAQLEDKKELALIDLEVSRLSNTTKERNATREMALQVSHMYNVAAAFATAADDAERIRTAVADGNIELADTLTKQRALHEQQARVAAHNLTPTQIHDARHDARKFASDDKKALAQEADMQKRLGNLIGVVDPEGDLERARKAGKITRGSRLDRFAEGQIAKRAIAVDQTMKVTLMNTSTMNVSHFSVGNL